MHAYFSAEKSLRSGRRPARGILNANAEKFNAAAYSPIYRIRVRKARAGWRAERTKNPAGFYGCLSNPDAKTIPNLSINHFCNKNPFSGMMAIWKTTNPSISSLAYWPLSAACLHGMRLRPAVLTHLQLALVKRELLFTAHFGAHTARLKNKCLENQKISFPIWNAQLLTAKANLRYAPTLG